MSISHKDYGAWSALREKYPGVTMELVGELLEELEDLALRLKRTAPGYTTLRELLARFKEEAEHNE